MTQTLSTQTLSTQERVARPLPPRARRRGRVFGIEEVRAMCEANAILSTMLEIRAWRLARILEYERSPV